MSRRLPLQISTTWKTINPFFKHLPGVCGIKPVRGWLTALCFLLTALFGIMSANLPFDDAARISLLLLVRTDRFNFMKTDSFFYRFFSEFPEAFFALIGEDPDKAEMYTFKSVEVKEQAFRFDGIFVPESSSDHIYFVEVQFTKQLEFYARFFSEIFLYLRQYQPRSDWRAVVIFPDEPTDPGIHRHYREFFLNRRLYRVHLDQLPATQLKRFPLNLLQIINVENEKVPDIVKELITQVTDEVHDVKLREVTGEMLVNLLLNKLGNLTREEIQKMTEPLLSNIKNTRFYQEVKQEGREEGREEGKAEGLAKGIEKTARNMLAKGLDVSLIAEVTGLSEPAILKLKSDNGQ